MERLPYPVVYYPNHYGTYFAFAEEESSSPALCTCSRRGIENLLRLKRIPPDPANTDARRNTLLDHWHFPDAIAEVSKQSGPDALNHIRFVQGLCHRCNLTPPSLRYCHEMYGTRFIQHFGWYVNQAYLRLGIHPMSLQYLPDVCPMEYQEQIRDTRAATHAFQAEQMRLMALAQGPKQPDIADEEVTYWRNVKYEDAELMVSLRRKSERTKRVFTKEIENSVRQDFGFRKVGEGWVSETLLRQIVSQIFDGYALVPHHRPDWLNGLELDLHIPDLRLAFEYQGQQHFHPVAAWGGQEALGRLRTRDAEKVRACKEAGVTLITVDYTEPLTQEHIRSLLQEHFGF